MRGLQFTAQKLSVRHFSMQKAIRVCNVGNLQQKRHFLFFGLGDRQSPGSLNGISGYHVEQQIFILFFRWILRCCISDSTGGSWASAFNEAGNALVGMKATEAEKLLEEQGPDEFEKIFNNAMWKNYVFKMRAKIDNYSVSFFFKLL